jgi:hypothetical protein
MRKLSFLLGILGPISFNLYSSELMRMRDYKKTDFDYMYEVKVDAYSKVILDCQGFIKGMNFYQEKKLEQIVYMDEEECDQSNEFLKDSIENQRPVCIELDTDEHTILFSRKIEDCD